MNCLWLTLADPEPAINGQFLYSRGLIAGAAQAGMNLTVAALARPGGLHRDGEQTDGVLWRLVPHRPRSRWRGVVSRSPIVVSRTRTRQMRSLMEALLTSDHWDSIVIESMHLGWILRSLLRRYPGTAMPTLVHIAHNHEASIATRLASVEPVLWKRPLKRLDAMKMTRLEHALIRCSDLVTANSPEDCDRFRAEAPDKPVLFLPPGYSGQPLASRRIDPSLPRRAIIVGTFDWEAKRASLASFLAVADPLFAASGIELYVVGAAEESFLAGLRKTVTATHLTGRVEDVTPFMRAARLALVPDQLGGFKLKSLDYIFNRLPILGIDGSVPGLPLKPGKGILLYPDHESLARGVVAMIDDVDQLNAIQETAFADCCGRFDCEGIGRSLMEAIQRVQKPGPGVERRLAARSSARPSSSELGDACL